MAMSRLATRARSLALQGFNSAPTARIPGCFAGRPGRLQASFSDLPAARAFCAAAEQPNKATPYASSNIKASVKGLKPLDGVVEVDYHELLKLSPVALDAMKRAFVGPKSYGAIAVINIPGYAEKRRAAFRAGIDLALLDEAGRARAAAVNNTYPGWSGTPGSETHPLQSSFLFNVKEAIPDGKVDPFFGKNIFPSEEYRKTWVELVTPMHQASMQVLRGCDAVMEAQMAELQPSLGWSASGRSLARLGEEGPALAGRFICYDSGFTREDTLLEDQPRAGMPVEHSSSNEYTLDPFVQKSTVCSKPVGHAADGLASMRTHSTPVKSAGHAGDGLASMRTHSTPVKSAGHAGDGLASMRTHSTPVKSAGHAGDGLASMRTHSTPVKSAGHAGDGLASMRTHSTPVKSAGHAGDGLASMRTHSTPVKSAGHAGDGLASMRTHSTPVKSAGHAGDGLASMRTHSTPVKSAGHAGDGLASMRTHSTPVKSAGHAGDGLASMRTHSTPVKSAGQISQAQRGHTTISVATNDANDVALFPLATAATEAEVESAAVMLHFPVEPAPVKETGDYWLPWHIDSNFVTVLHKEMYAYEHNGSFAPEPEGAGLLVMNQLGDIARIETDENAMLFQMGAFAQIYAGGQLTACRHAVLNPMPPGIARFNFCNFWYVPWHTVCDVPPGFEQQAVNKGWNAMMDESYVDITMRQSFSAFRQFMTSPEARLQFADSVRFKELSEMFPLPAKLHSAWATAFTSGEPAPAEIVIDVMTDIRCPISFMSQTKLQKALSNLGLDGRTTMRFHPIFLNPNVPKEGEHLDDYLLREFGYTKEFAHSADYPIRKAGLEAGINFSPHRRVVNTFDAFCVLHVAQRKGRQWELAKVLSRRYFEEAEDISSASVLRAAVEEVGLDGDLVMMLIATTEVRSAVTQTYEALSEMIGEVPHFVLREQVSGNGLEVGGNHSVQDWEKLLETVLEKGRFVGMAIPGPYGRDVWLTEANPNAPVSLSLPAQHGWAPALLPFTPEDFSRIDESPDTSMYSEPRVVNHLDEASIGRLTEVYRNVFQAVPPGFAVLDLCSSWTSHYPLELLNDARVVVHGLNEKELEANPIATERHVQDLNANAKLPWADSTFDFVTMALSVQYLTDPCAVFAEMHRVLRPGGMAIVSFSHRAFIEKAVRSWAAETYDGEGRAHVLCRYFQHGPQGGWEKLASVDSSPRHGDPVWLVTAIKTGFKP